MSKLQQAGEAVRHLAKQYRAVIELGAQLEALGALENYEAEINERIQKAKGAEAAAREAQAAAERTTLDLVEKNERIIGKAQSDAADIVLNAKDEAARLLAEANAQADHNFAVVNERVAHASVEADAAEERQRAAEAAVKVAARQLAELTSEYEALRAKLA